MSATCETSAHVKNGKSGLFSYLLMPLKMSITSVIVFETISLIAVILLAGRLYWGAGFDRISPNPLWIPVVIMSSQYGAVAGVLAAIGGTIALYGASMPSRQFPHDFYVYASLLAWQPTQWVTYALLVGGLRSLHILHASRIQSNLDDSMQTMIEFADGLDRALAEINRLEYRIVEDSGTLNAALRSLAEISYHDADAVMTGFAPLISDALGALSFTIYVRDHDQIKPCFRFSREGDDGARGAPTLGDSLWRELQTIQDINIYDSLRTCSTSSSWPCAAPIRFPEDRGTFGVLLVERIQPSREMREVTKRLRLLCIALGRALDAAVKKEGATNVVSL